MTEYHPRRTEGKPKRGMSPKGFAFLALAALMIFGVLFWLFMIDEIWSQIVAGIFIAALVVPPLLFILMWLVLRSEVENQIAAKAREEERQRQVAAEAAERRARSRRNYVGPDGLPES